MFFIRVEWDLRDFVISEVEFEKEFQILADEFKASWYIKYSRNKSKIAIFVSKYDHCLQEILWRNSYNELDTDISLIVSNHEDLRFLADRYNIPFYYFPVTKENKLEQEKNELALLKEKKIDTIVLARYMQVLSPSFLNSFSKSIINIHHSFYLHLWVPILIEERTSVA
jgi:formyltetrahydrofolate deformylase